MVYSQRKFNAREDGRQSIKRGQAVAKHQLRTPVRKSARLKAIQKRDDLQGQTIQQHPISSLSTVNTCSSIGEKPSSLKPKIYQTRKRSREADDLVPKTKNQCFGLERQTFTRKNEEQYQLPSPSKSNSRKQLYRKRRRQTVFSEPRSQETKNHCSITRNSPIVERPEEEPEVSEREEKYDPVSYWAANYTWPDNFAESRGMSSSNNNNKRPRVSDRSQSGKDEKPRSYSQSRKDKDVPEQYTKSYEKYIFTQGLNMNYIKNREVIALDNTVTCQELLKVKCTVVFPTVYSENKILEAITLCRNRNEAMVNRDVTPLIVPSIKSLYLMDGGEHFEHLADEVNTQWHESWVLAGPRPKPGLAVGFSSSAFTIAENEKLTKYTSFENLTRPTDELCFPFLMCEVKCGNEVLDYADRQNMHSCSVAVKAILKLEQKADQYREDKQFESLLGKMLVYSISHDQNDARVEGHYALIEGEKWTYYRHHIGKFDIANKKRDLLTLHNFARNVLTVYAPKLLERLQKAIAALPVSSTLSRTMNLEDGSQQGSQQPSQGRDAEGFAIPGLPVNAQRLFDQQKEQMDKLLQQLEQQREDSKQDQEQSKQAIERQRQENVELKEESKQAIERQRQENLELKEQIKSLMDMMKSKFK